MFSEETMAASSTMTVVKGKARQRRLVERAAGGEVEQDDDGEEIEADRGSPRR